MIRRKLNHNRGPLAFIDIPFVDTLSHGTGVDLVSAPFCGVVQS